MVKGIVKWFNNEKKYGFILYEDNKEAFVHFSEIQVEGYKTLRKGDDVEFELAPTDKGMKAVQVRIVRAQKRTKAKARGDSSGPGIGNGPDRPPRIVFHRRTWSNPEHN